MASNATSITTSDTSASKVEQTLEWLTSTYNEYINVVLIGGGHSHCIVLKTLATQQDDQFCMHCHKIRLIMISNSKESYYSGMLPGCIAKMYTEDQMQIHIDQLCEYYNVTFILGEACAVDSQERMVTFTYERDNGQYVPAVLQYDILSIDVGSINPSLPGSEYAVTTRPIHQLLQSIEKFEEVFYSTPTEKTLDIVIVGGGAAGAELSWSLKARFDNPQLKHSHLKITLVCSTPELLWKSGSWVSTKVYDALVDKGIDVIFNSRALQVAPNQLTITDQDHNQTILDFDMLVLATGAAPPKLIEHTDLAKDSAGFIRITDTLQSVTSPFVFAAGDCASLENCTFMTKAGVYAVREGPVLAQNIITVASALRKSCTDDVKCLKLKRYVPQKGFMAMLNTGDGDALSSWKGIALKNKWIMKAKDKLDKDFMQQFAVPVSYDPMSTIQHQ